MNEKLRGTKRAMFFVWKNERKNLSLSIFYGIICGLFPSILLILNRELINVISDIFLGYNNKYIQALILLITIAIVTLFSSTLTGVREFNNRKIEVKVGYSLQRMLNIKLLDLPMNYLDSPDMYNHYNRISGNMSTQFLAPVNNIINLMQIIFTLITYIAILITIHWSLILLPLIYIIPAILIQTKLGKNNFLFNFHQSSTNREILYINSLFSNKQSSKEIRIFGLKNYFLERWSSKYLNNVEKLLLIFKKQFYSSITLDILRGFLYSVTALIIISLSKTIKMKIGDFLIITQAVQSMQGSLQQTAHVIGSINTESLYIIDFYKFIDYKINNIYIEKKVLFPDKLKEGIKITNLSFKYINNATNVISDINLFIKANETIAIVGENGSGKTTLAKCLLGLYPASEGSITFDGIDINNIESGSFTENVTGLLQDFVKYPFTIRENIGFGNIENINDLKQIINAGNKSGVNDFVEGFPDKYETYLSNLLFSGEELSGGQWQKVAIARGLFGKSEVVILDEPTSALDPIAESEIISKFLLIAQEKTTIMISHKISAARLADRIIVMKNGMIFEEGTHEDLMSIKGDYYKMFKLQSKWYTEQSVYEEVE